MPLPITRFKKLSAREWSVLKMLAQGIIPALIAVKLAISVKTVSQHTLNMAKKLGVENRLLLQKMLVTINYQRDPILPRGETDNRDANRAD